MRFAFQPIEALPALAWLATVTRGVATVDVRYGPRVETGGTFFVEGAWRCTITATCELTQH